jgi:hypothetical protein
LNSKWRHIANPFLQILLLNRNFLLAHRKRYLVGMKMPPRGFSILITTLLLILMFVFLQKPFKFWVEKGLEMWMSKISSIHVCQCPLSILWQGFLVANGKVFVCCILEKVANIKNDWLFSLMCEHHIWYLKDNCWTAGTVF